MADIQGKIAVIEAEMARTQKNKATNYHLGTLKAKLAKLRTELIDGPGGKSSGTKNAERGFDVTKSGDTRIGLGTYCLRIITYINNLTTQNCDCVPSGLTEGLYQLQNPKSKLKGRKERKKE